MVRFRFHVGVHWRYAREPGRDFDHCLVDDHRDRVQVSGKRGEPEPLCLQRDGPSPGEGIQDRWKPVREALVDLGAGLG